MEAGVDMLVVPVSASEGHSRANVRRTPDEMVTSSPHLRGAGRDEPQHQNLHRDSDRFRLHDPGRGVRR